MSRSDPFRPLRCYPPDPLCGVIADSDSSVELFSGRVLVGCVMAVDEDAGLFVMRPWGCFEPVTLPLHEVRYSSPVRAHTYEERRAVGARQRQGLSGIEAPDRRRKGGKQRRPRTEPAFSRVRRVALTAMVGESTAHRWFRGKSVSQASAAKLKAAAESLGLPLPDGRARGEAA